MHSQALAQRPKAASTCRKNGWVEGTWLRSKKWSKDRRIFQIGRFTESVVFKDSDNNHYDSITLPPDVHEIKAPAGKKKFVFLICHFGADYAYRNRPDAYHMREILAAALSSEAANRARNRLSEKMAGMDLENNDIRVVEIEVVE